MGASPQGSQVESSEVRGSFSDPWFFDIVDEMKGHVGDGVCFRGFGARVSRLNQSKLACLYVTIRIDVQGKIP